MGEKTRYAKMWNASGHPPRSKEYSMSRFSVAVLKSLTSLGFVLSISHLTAVGAEFPYVDPPYLVDGTTLLELRVAPDGEIAGVLSWGLAGARPVLGPVSTSLLHGLDREGPLELVSCNRMHFPSGAIQRLGRFPRARTLIFCSSDLCDEHIPALRMRPLRELILYETRITDATLAEIADLTKLEVLDLGKTSISGDGLHNLRRMQRLKQLSVAWNDINDAHLEHLVVFPWLEKLYLGGTSITNAGLKHVVKIRSLKMLAIDGTKIGDDGIKQLSALGQLKMVIITGCAATPAIREWTKENMPGVEFVGALHGDKAPGPSGDLWEVEPTLIPQPLFSAGCSIPDVLLRLEEEQRTDRPLPSMRRNHDSKTMGPEKAPVEPGAALGANL